MILLALALARPAAATPVVSDNGYVYGSGGDKTWWDPNGVSDCQNTSPIAGTAGYRNARSAITTNATTYGAAQWAQRNLFPLVHGPIHPDHWTGGWGTETNLVFTATRVPSLELGYPFGSCPYNYRVSMRPLDLGASNFGFAARRGRVGLFYAASMTWSSPAFANNAARGMMTGSYAIWGGVGAIAAPLMGKLDYDTGVGTITADWIAGASIDATYVQAEAGYVGSQGFYGNVEEGRVGFFGSALLQRGLKGLPFFKAGADRVESPAGMSSVYARKLPLQALPRYLDTTGTPAPGTDDQIEDSLQTAHLEQRNLGGRFDLLAAYAWKPRPQLFDAQAAIHSKGYHQARAANDAAEQSQGMTGQESTGWIIQGGVVNLPDLWYYGVQGGIHGSAHLEVTGTLAEGLYVQGRLLWNDPELLALYPFAYDAVWLSYRMWIRF